MNKVVIVTGASGGLGSAVAARFGADGNKVVVHYYLPEEDPERVARAVKAKGGEAFLYQADVLEYPQVKKMIDDIIAKWGRIDVLVNCAGGTAMHGNKFQEVADMDEDVWDSTVDVNLKGTFFCIKAVLPQMKKQKEGHIINVSSGMGLSGSRGRACYAAAKSGILGLNKSVAIEVGEYNIKVNAVCPGLILHDRIKNYPSALHESIKSMNTLHRTGTPEEFAGFVFHLSTMNNISGQTINLDSRILF